MGSFCYQHATEKKGTSKDSNQEKKQEQGGKGDN